MNYYSHVFVDESGEFGLSADSSDYLVVVALLTNDSRSLEKIAKKVWNNLRVNKKNAQEIHAADAKDRVIHKTLQLLNRKAVAIKAYVYKKPKTSSCDVHLVYYNMLEKLVADNDNAFSIVIDKRDTNKKRKEMVQRLTRPHLFQRVVFEDSRKVKQLQVVDVVSWAIFQSLEFGIHNYLEYLSDTALETEIFRPKRKPSALTNH